MSTFFDRRFGLLLTQLAFAVLLVNELVQLWQANGKLAQTIEQQAANDDTIKKINSQLDALARGTQKLAQGGNANAQKIVDQLAASGVRINAKP